jgi:hypothetical protein
MAGRSEVEASAAYAAMADSGRRVLALIEREVERGDGALSLETIMGEAGICRSAARYGVEQIEQLNFATVSTGPRRISLFALSDGWRALDAVEAKRRAKLARGPAPTPASQRPSRASTTFRACGRCLSSRR